MSKAFLDFRQEFNLTITCKSPLSFWLKLGMKGRPRSYLKLREDEARHRTAEEAE